MANLKDVAKQAGLSVNTVSRVLNNRGYISDKTKEKVYRVMKEMNYQPNEMARALFRKNRI
ncbi:LacI family DNA-binding transcriptional regulator [Paenibacillus rhizoplanae]